MKKYTIYARFSSDKQNPMSSADQIDLCQKYITYRNDGMLVKTYHDDGLSGADPNRPALQEMVADAKNRMFDMLVVASQDRIYRDQAEMIQLYKIFKYLDIKIYSLQEQEINEMNVTLQGYTSENYLSALKQNVRRGQHAALKRKTPPMSTVFGYTQNDDKTWSINKAEAQIVKWVFTMKIEGLSNRQVADILNKPNQPIAYRSKYKWTPNHIRYIIKKPIYKGILIWGATRRVRNPMTGKIEYIGVPKQDQTVLNCPEYRIVNNKTWQQAQPKKEKVNRTRHGMPYPLYKKVICAECGNCMNIAHSRKGKQGIEVYRYLLCRNLHKSNMKACTADKWIRLNPLTDDVFRCIMHDLNSNPEWARAQIQQSVTVNRPSFEKMRTDMVSKIFRVKSFDEYLAYIQSHTEYKIIDIQKIIARLEWALKAYAMDRKDPNAVSVMQIFVKNVYAKRTGIRDTTKYDFTYEIDRQAIAMNLHMLH